MESTQGTLAGFFDDREAMSAWVANLTTGCKVQGNYGEKLIPGVPTVYLTINPIQDDFLSVINNRVRAVKTERMDGKGKVVSEGECSKDDHILRRARILIDADPARVAKTSSTDAEHELAMERVRQILAYLTGMGAPEPCLADSGNGGHLIYATDLPNDAESTTLIKDFMAALGLMFGDEKVGIDQGVYNAGRLCTVYGTWKKKGDSTAKRPHRVSKILDSPATLSPVPREILAAVAAQARPQQPDKPPQGSKQDDGVLNMQAMLAERYRLAGKRDDHWLKSYAGDLRTLDVPALFESRKLDARDKGDRYEVTCPWGAEDHTDGNDGGAVVFKEDGEYPTFHCRHDHCKDRKMADVCAWFGREAIDASCGAHFQTKSAKKPTSPAGANEPGVVVVSNRQLRDLTADAMAAVAAANQPPRWFRRGGVPVRVVDSIDDEGGVVPIVQEMRAGAIKNILAESADWIRINAKGERSNCFPPDEVVTDVANSPRWDLPGLVGIVETPVFTSKGTLLSKPGYDPISRLWFRPGAAMDKIAVPSNPSPGEIAAARSLILDDLLVDFPFDSQAGRANAVATLLLYFARQMIAGSTPLHISDAPANRTGKTLIFDLICTVWTGRRASTTAECHGDEEWNKTLTSLLISASPYIFIDNINYAVSSGAFASILTTDRHKGRVLGSNRTVDLPVRAIFLGSGNNPKLSGELARRVVKFRLDAGVENPELRPVESFKHPDIRGWTADHRKALVQACLTLVQAWVAAGRPPGKYTLGGYERYVQTMGGILDVAGIPGFLGSLAADIADMNTSDAGWSAIIYYWQALHKGEPFSAADLMPLVESHNLLTSVIDGKTDRARATQLGNALGRVAGRIFNGVKIDRDRDESGNPLKDRHGVARYRLVTADPLRSAVVEPGAEVQPEPRAQPEPETKPAPAPIILAMNQPDDEPDILAELYPDLPTFAERVKAWLAS